jgi:hypothetical protein
MLSASRMIAVLAIVLVLAWAGMAQAAVQPMFGSLGVINPSVAGNQGFERGPDIAGADTGMTPTGAVTTTALGKISLPAGQFQIGPATQFRFFAQFAPVAQLSNTHLTTQAAAVFNAGSGAAAGGNIDFCPAKGAPTAASTATLLFATGKTNCLNFNTVGTATAGIRIGVNNTGTTHFGGVLKMLRAVDALVWFVPGLPTPNNPTAQVSAAPRDFFASLCGSHNVECANWTPGLSNYRFNAAYNALGPNYSALLTPSGKVSSILGFISTPPGTVPNGENVGFKMTTGTISGSDIYPGNFPTATPTRFFFKISGTDNRVVSSGGGLTGNIVLVGGGTASSPASGNLFHRVTILDMTVPEPGMALSLAAGVLGLVGLARLRSRR